jgi:hypothetical protein
MDDKFFPFFMELNNKIDLHRKILRDEERLLEALLDYEDITIAEENLENMKEEFKKLFEELKQ